jgi:hypothetical protein
MLLTAATGSGAERGTCARAAVDRVLRTKQAASGATTRLRLIGGAHADNRFHLQPFRPARFAISRNSIKRAGT